MFQMLPQNMWTGDLFNLKVLFSDQESTLYMHFFSGFMSSGLPLAIVILVPSVISSVFQSTNIHLFSNLSHPKNNSNIKTNSSWHHIPLCLLHTGMCFHSSALIHTDICWESICNIMSHILIFHSLLNLFQKGFHSHNSTEIDLTHVSSDLHLANPGFIYF